MPEADDDSVDEFVSDLDTSGQAIAEDELAAFAKSMKFVRG